MCYSIGPGGGLLCGGELRSPELGPTEGLGAQIARDLDRRVDRGRQLVVARDLVDLSAALQLDGVGRDDLDLAVVLGLQGAGALEERGVLAGRDLVLVGRGGGRGDLLVGGRGSRRRGGGSRSAGRDHGGWRRRSGGLLELLLQLLEVAAELLQLLLLGTLVLRAVYLHLAKVLVELVTHPEAGRDEGDGGEAEADDEGAAGIEHPDLLGVLVEVDDGINSRLRRVNGHVYAPFTMLCERTFSVGLRVSSEIHCLLSNSTYTSRQRRIDNQMDSLALGQFVSSLSKKPLGERFVYIWLKLVLLVNASLKTFTWLVKLLPAGESTSQQISIPHFRPFVNRQTWLI